MYDLDAYLPTYAETTFDEPDLATEAAWAEWLDVNTSKAETEQYDDQEDLALYHWAGGRYHGLVHRCRFETGIPEYF